MSSTTESPFSLTIKVGPNNDLLTGRADTVDEMSIRIQQLQALANQMQGVTQVVTTPTVEQAVQNFTDAGMTGAVISGGGIEVRNDQWGNKYTRGNPDAGACPHGPRIVKNGTNKSGKEYKAYVCLNDSPFREGKYNKANVCETAWPSR